ncbi:MAG TPA: large conductance mechanosensitive channel protein MscL [Dehalococcoidia bacterium]
MTILSEFKAFLLRGNVVDLAVAIVIGVAFGVVVTSMVEDLITPIVAAIVGEPSFGGLTIDIGDSKLFYGSFLNAVFSFVTIAAAVFFFVVLPYGRFVAASRKDPPPDPTTQKCPECLSEIPAEARRCAFCTSPVVTAA